MNSDALERSRFQLNRTRLRYAFASICAAGCLLAAAATTARAAPSPPLMKAIVAHEYGGPEVLKYEEVPVPEPKPREILVRVIASGVNPADPLIVSGKFAKEFGTHLPLIPGYDVAGLVEKTGSDIKRVKQGDAVYGYPLFGGGWAEYALLNETEFAPKPTTLNFIEAAAVPLAALTAWQALVDAAHLEAGQTVLIHGGSGGVGHFAVQLAKWKGARVIATASTANQEFLKQLGADVTVDYTKERFEDRAHEVDGVLDTVGGETLARSYSVVKKGGFVATIRGPLVKAELQRHELRGLPIAVKPDADQLAQLARLIDEKKIRPVVTQVLPLNEAASADGKAAMHHTRGKVVLKIATEGD